MSRKIEFLEETLDLEREKHQKRITEVTSIFDAEAEQGKKQLEMLEIALRLVQSLRILEILENPRKS